MNAIEILIDLARRPQHSAEALSDVLTPELVNAHPHHDNSIAWLLWHAAREIDVQLAELTGGESVWVAGGYAERFGLDVAPGDLGYGHSPEQARAIVVRDTDLLVEHLAAVVEAQVAYIASLSETDLERVVDDNWDPVVTLGVRLVSISADALEHLAQATYVAGMGAQAFEAR
ncbi:mycothiol transferase [Leucobacter komagatae]|uniref:Aspartate/tyrosine/aromatic aminotransferase n=1 Tax=Leucobacter komagatae TaxID=55969 RepID=A0A0D0ILX7_9MICO|nr:DinB family protein [Leucobacter komagatae]KIP52584.1 aspartate/tyrosine/aromatic aminotransferase [Leucobacter komagatae]